MSRIARAACPVTIKDVAALAGVSTATASRVLAGSSAVTPKLARRVQKAAHRLDYSPNRAARTLRVRKGRTIGVIVPDLENPFFTNVISGIETVLQEADYTMILASLGENPQREAAYLNMLRGEALAGVIFTPTIAQTGDYTPFQRSGMALVAVSRRPRDLRVDFVTVANECGAFEAASHLISHGYRRIGFIGGAPSAVSTTLERLAGFERAISEAGLPLPRELIRFGDFRATGGWRAMTEMLDLPEPPAAVFSGSAMTTLGALRTIHERKLRIPDDIALLGFDDMPWGASLQPPLTAVEQPTFAIGRTAAKLLLERLREPERPLQQVELPTRLIVRASCGHQH